MTRLLCRLTNHRLMVATSHGHWHARACWCGMLTVIWKTNGPQVLER